MVGGRVEEVLTGSGALQGVVQLCTAAGATAESWVERVTAALATAGWRVGGFPAEAVILVIPNLTGSMSDWTGRFIRSVPEGPKLLVTSGSRSNLKRLASLVVDAVVLDEEIELALATRIEQIARIGLRLRIAREAARSKALDSLVRNAVIELCTADAPIGSVKSLCRRLDGVDPTTFWRSWGTAPQCFGRTTDFLQRAAVLHFIDLRSERMSVEAACQVLQFGRTTLYDRCDRHFGISPGALWRDPTPARGWVNQVLRVLQGPAGKIAEINARPESAGNAMRALVE